MTGAQIGLIVLGMCVGGAGVWTLVKARVDGRRWRFEGVEPSGRSLSTRTTLGLVLVLAGYHLIVWAFPASMTSVQLIRERWWLWLGLGVLAVGLSVVIDRFDRPTDSGDGSNDRPAS